MRNSRFIAIASLTILLLALTVSAAKNNNNRNHKGGNGKGGSPQHNNSNHKGGNGKGGSPQHSNNNHKGGNGKGGSPQHNNSNHKGGNGKGGSPKHNNNNGGNHKGGKPNSSQGKGKPGNAAKPSNHIAAQSVSASSSGGSVKGTFWSTQTDAGGCSLPEANYAVVDAIALGQMSALGGLKWEAGLCGQVLSISCGGGEPVQAVVASTCNVGSDSCGVDMIKRTWDKATGNKSPGEVQCKVSLAHTNPLHEDHMVCYNRPSTDPSPYYVNLGVLNTGGEILKSATLDGVEGQNSNGGWFAFNAQGGKTFGDNAVAEFTFKSGKTTKFFLKNCQKSGSVHIFK